MTHNIEVESGKTVKLPTAGKYCDRDILVTATGGGGYTEADLQAKYDEGVKAEYDRFWDNYQEYGNRTDYSLGRGTFGGACWTDELFKPKYPIRPTAAGYMFRQTGITDLTREDIVLDFSSCSSFNYAFSYSQLTKLPQIDLSSATNMTSAFDSFKGTDLSLVFSETIFTTGSTFSGVSNLVNLTISGVIGKTLNIKDAPLSAASIESVMTALSTTAIGQTLTLSKKAVSAAFTDEEWATLANTRSNWTINLV